MITYPLEPNRDLIMPHAWDVGFVALGGAGITILGLIGLYRLFTKNDPVVLFLILGGFLGEALEPICDVLGWAYHPEIGQIVGFETLSRKIPLWLVLMYPWYFGAFAYRLISWDANGMLTPKRYWGLLAGAATFCFCIEIFPVQAVLWDYFGPAPLKFFSSEHVNGMALLWYVANPTAVVGTAALSGLAVRGRKGWQTWPVLAMMPIGMLGFHTGVAGPTYITMNAGWSANESILGMAFTAFYCATLLWTFSRLLFNTQLIVPSRA